MRTRSKVLGGLAATALIVAAASPASARGWGWGPPRHDHHDSDAGVIVGALVGVGIIAAIASAASSKNRQADDRRYDYDAPPPSDYPRDGQSYDNRYDDRGADYDGRRDAAPPAGRGITSAEDAAVDGCVLAARDQASGTGDYVEIRGVDGVAPKGSGWEVTGHLDQRSSYRANDGWSRNFRCSWQDGRVSALSLD